VVEHLLAKEDVASSSLVTRSPPSGGLPPSPAALFSQPTVHDSLDPATAIPLPSEDSAGTTAKGSQRMIISSPSMKAAIARTEGRDPITPTELPVRTLGVLLVHGIGDQQRGRTLTQFGEPLFNCLEKWMRYHGGGAELAQVILRGNPGAPAHAIVRLWHERKSEKVPTTSEPSRDAVQTDADAAARVETKWVLAESNWADAFERPGFKSVAFWSIRVVPWFILTQFTDQLAEDLRKGRFGRALFSFGYLVLTFPLALLIQLLVLLLVPMSLLAPLRPVVAPIQRWISGVIGDTFVLLNSRFQFQAMVSKVRQDIGWLSRRCEVLVVIAHSQGAAVAHEAVQQAREPKLERLITFGSAVSRLKALRYVLDNAPGMLTASSLVTMTALMLAGLYLWSLLAAGGSLFYAVVGIWSLGILLAFSAYMMPFTLKGINEQCHAKQRFGLSAPAEWDDYYATSDPVPNGSMLDGTHYTKRDREVHNQANVFRDHSSYWRNLDQFGIAVVQTLMRLTRGPFEASSSFSKAGNQRAFRVQMLVSARLAAFAVLGLAMFQHPFFKGGMAVPLWMQIPFGWLAGFVNWVIALAGDAISLVATKLRLIATAFAAPQIPTPVEVLSWPVACGLLAILWYILSTGILRWWEKTDTQDCYRGTSRGGPPTRAWWTVFCALTFTWLTFWISWLLVNPADVWSQVSGRFKSFGEATGAGWNRWLILLFSLYQVIQTLKKTREMQREVQRPNRNITRLLEAEAGALPAGLESSLQSRLYRSALPLATEKESYSTWEIIVDVVERFFVGLMESLRSIGRRQDFSGGFAATISALMATAALAVVLLDLKVQGVMQAAMGLVCLSFGVLGWVRGSSRMIRLLAALGMVIGVVAMPAITAVRLGFGGVGAASLLALGAVSASCALAGAESLRQGWRGLKRVGDEE
jgi:hypothetical protein